MNKNKAYKMVSALGESFHNAAVDIGCAKQKDGWDSDLFNGLAGFQILKLTDEDIPDITKAVDIVWSDIRELVWQGVQKHYEAN
tara:strand:- start:84 stop:335 length:252 start_codon:yes stop_codon:yes gene_type:complete